MSHALPQYLRPITTPTNPRPSITKATLPRVRRVFMFQSPTGSRSTPWCQGVELDPIALLVMKLEIVMIHPWIMLIERGTGLQLARLDVADDHGPGRDHLAQSVFEDDLRGHPFEGAPRDVPNATMD